MNEILDTLSFAVIPLVLVTMISLVLPGVGAILNLRNEIMLALALPSVANAGMALGLFCGIDHENSLLLYMFAATITLVCIYGVGISNVKNQRRALNLAGLFISGQIVSFSFSAISPHAQTRVAHLLNGEILAVGWIETSLLGFLCLLICAVGFINRAKVFSWCADDEYFRMSTRNYNVFTMSTYILISFVITIGVADAGVLLVTALLVLPALAADIRKGGVGRYFIIAILLGVAGSSTGFIAAIVIDFPPAVSAAAGVGVLGLVLHLFFQSVFNKCK
jgi:zinc transport system permease protein